MSTLNAEKPQHLESLERANKIHKATATATRQLANNERSLESTLYDENLARIPISTLLIAMPYRRVAARRKGRGSLYNARKVLQISCLNPARPVGSLTDTSREELLDAAEKVAGHVAWVREEREGLQLRPPVRNEGAHNEAQRTAALSKANQVRTARKEAKELMRAGDMDLAEALEHEALQTCGLGKVVVNLRRVTPAGDCYTARLAPNAATKVLRDNLISSLVTPAELSPDGKRLLVMMFADERFRKPDPVSAGTRS